MLDERLTLMVQGTTSDAGKSLLVAGLCRLFKRRGLKVAPFKPQNLALNSAVTADGGEIGRAQAVQAQACGLQPHTDFNPVLLKPNADGSMQVIINGKAVANRSLPVASAPAAPSADCAQQQRQSQRQQARDAVLAAYTRLKEQYDLVVVEGAGSPAEINLRDNDIANMGFAEAVDCPVLLVSDIERGGVFAHIVGTLALLSDSEQARIIGSVINRFHGDPALLTSGTAWLEQRTGKPVLGVIPFIESLYLDAEDTVDESQLSTGGSEESRLRVVIPVLPGISNHTDFDPLRLIPEVDVIFARPGSPLPPADLVILPGSKSVRADLAVLRAEGWERAIQRHLRYGGKLMGICGGFQMLGEWIRDPHGIEDESGDSPGLAYLALETELVPDKQLRQVSGRLMPDGADGASAEVSGYEIHAGITQGAALDRPLLSLPDGPEGARSEDNQIQGSYLHGIFDQADAARALLTWAGLSRSHAKNSARDLMQHREQSLERLADALESHLDIEQLLTLIKA